MFERFSLRLRIFLFFAFLAFASAGLALAGLTLGYVRLAEPYALSAFVSGGFVAVFAIVALTTWVWVLFDENVAKPVERLAAEMRARVHGGVNAALPEAPARYLGDLAPAAAAVTGNLTETRNAMAMAVGRATAGMAAETARLEALLAEMPDGVLLCTADHVIALYNGQVAEVLGSGDALGLGRPLAGLVRLAPVEMAYARLAQGGNHRGGEVRASDKQGSDILVTTRAGARLLEARMRLVRLPGQETDQPGYVLSLRDVSGELPVQAERAHLLERVLEGVREAADLAGAQAVAEAVALRKRATDTKWWPMEALAASDLGAALVARLARKGVALTSDLGAELLRCDGFAVTRLLERLALEWANSGGTELVVRLVGDAPEAVVLSLEAGSSAPTGFLQWVAGPLVPGMSGFSGRDVLVCHGTALAVEPAGPGRFALRLSLSRAVALAAKPGREVSYDFELLNRALPETLGNAALAQVNYVVFDTETTGLNPAVDEVCQIAAVRIVNGRVRAAERFDMLVDPGRAIPAAATAVHHVTDAMVKGAPGVAEALQRFHTFAEGAVLIAHNAPFDMAFVRRREAEIGKRFDQPILDTVLCSAILWGQSAEHTLDVLCARLGIVIPEAARHTALGDAVATAEAMARRIPMLVAVDLGQLSALIRAFDRHKRLIEHLN